MMFVAMYADKIAAMPTELLAFWEFVRHFGFALGILDIVLLSLPREVDYPVIRAPRFRDILTIPTANKKYMLVMVVVFAWQFSLYCHNTFLQVYLMDTVGVSYFLYCFVIFVYPFFFPFSMKFWQNRISKTSWLRALALALIIEAPLQLLYALIRPDLAPWLLVTMLLAVRLPQHFAGVGRNSIVANMQYVNMPQHNRTCYTSFYQIVFNLGAAAGLLFGTAFVAISKNFALPLFGYTYKGGIPWLIALSGIIQLGIVAYILLMGKRLEPDTQQEGAA
jgi:predicted MFS family arabinose efflux permease